MLVVRALYGTKSAGASWRMMLAERMRDLKFQPSRAERTCGSTNEKPDGFEYYEMVFSALAELYELKAGSVGEPKQYFGANGANIQKSKMTGRSSDPTT